MTEQEKEILYESILALIKQKFPSKKREKTGSRLRELKDITPQTVPGIASKLFEIYLHVRSELDFAKKLKNYDEVKNVIIDHYTNGKDFVRIYEGLSVRIKTIEGVDYKFDSYNGLGGTPREFFLEIAKIEWEKRFPLFKEWIENIQEDLEVFDLEEKKVGNIRNGFFESDSLTIKNSLIDSRICIGREKSFLVDGERIVGVIMSCKGVEKG